MSRLEIIELLSTYSGELYYLVVENDGWRYLVYGSFKERKDAEVFLKQHPTGGSHD